MFQSINVSVMFPPMFPSMLPHSFPQCFPQCVRHCFPNVSRQCFRHRLRHCLRHRMHHCSRQVFTAVASLLSSPDPSLYLDLSLLHACTLHFDSPPDRNVMDHVTINGRPACASFWFCASFWLCASFWSRAALHACIDFCGVWMRGPNRRLSAKGTSCPDN
jgi:hypothetical protein